MFSFGFSTYMIFFYKNIPYKNTQGFSKKIDQKVKNIKKIL